MEREMEAMEKEIDRLNEENERLRKEAVYMAKVSGERIETLIKGFRSFVVMCELTNIHENHRLLCEANKLLDEYQINKLPSED